MKRFVTSLMIIASATLSGLIITPTVQAVDVFQSCTNASDSAVCKAKNDSATNIIQIVINTLLFILAGVAVIMIVIGGFKYVTSGGDSTGTKSAKDTILYAVIGLVVAIMSFAIVNFVIGRLK